MENEKQEQVCEHDWELYQQRMVHWYSWNCDHLFFYCKKCLATANLIRRDVKDNPTPLTSL